MRARSFVILCLADPDEVRYVCSYDPFFGAQSSSDLSAALRFPDIETLTPTIRGIIKLDEVFFPGVNPVIGEAVEDQFLGVSRALVDPARLDELEEHVAAWDLCIVEDAA